MKKLLPLILTFSLAVPSLVMAAPATPASTKPNPNIDPAAIKLLDKSAKVYASLKGASMTYAVKADWFRPSSTTISFLRPDKAKVEIVMDNATVYSIANAGQYWQRTYTKEKTDNYSETKSYPKSTPAIDKALTATFGAIYTVPIEILILGKNPLTAKEFDYGDSSLHSYRTSASLLPNNGVLINISTEAETARPKTALHIYLDKKTSLVLSVTVESLEFNPTQIAQTATLTSFRLNPKFAPDAFKLAAATPVKKSARTPVKKR